MPDLPLSAVTSPREALTAKFADISETIRQEASAASAGIREEASRKAAELEADQARVQEKMAAERARLESLWQGQPDSAAAALEAWDAANPAPTATIADMADHIDHVRQVAGIDHIGIGGDYDGMPTGPQGMEDVSGYPGLFVELARRGYSQADLEKIAMGNVLRAMRQAEAVAAAQADMDPIETPAS